MRILILGLSKSGTTILAYRILDGLEGRKKLVFEPSSFGRGRGESRWKHFKICALSRAHIVTKCLIFPRFNPNWETVRSCAQYYDKRIWIARDPRDRVISDFLYGPYWRHQPDYEPQRSQFEKLVHERIKRVKKKENDPKSIPFYSLSHTPELLRKNEKNTYAYLCNIAEELSADWFVVKYEDLIDGKVNALNQYLGVKVHLVGEIPDNMRRVMRSKTYGNWREWFNQNDEGFFKILYREYMERMGYDADDWNLVNCTRLNPRYGSEYIRELFHNRSL